MRYLLLSICLLLSMSVISCSKDDSQSGNDSGLFYCNLEIDGRQYSFKKMQEYGKNTTDSRTFNGYELAAGNIGEYEYYFMIRMSETPYTPVIGIGSADSFRYDYDILLDYNVCGLLKSKDHNGNYKFYESTLRRHVIENIYFDDIHRFIISGKFEFRFKLNDSDSKTITGKYRLPVK